MENSNLETEITWQIPEYEYRPKDVSWFWVSLIVALILIFLSMWQNNFLFAIFVAIAFFVVNFWSRKFPTIWEFKINKNGLEISLPNGESKKFYEFKDVESFDLHEVSDEYNELILKFKSRFAQALKINIFASDEEKIKKYLLNFMKQEEYRPSMVDSLSKIIGF